MANPLAGFVKGFANNQVDQIQERRKLENEEKKARMLAQLQADTQRANFLFEEGYKKSNTIDKSMSTTDYETGRITMRSIDGTEQGSREITKAEREAYAEDRAKSALDNENVRSTIDSRKATDADRSRDSARADRVATAQIGSYNRSGRGGLDGSGKEPDDFDRANELIYRYNKETAAAVKSGNISESAVRDGAVAIIQNSRTGEDAQRQFTTFLNRYRTGRKFTDERKRREEAGE